MRWGILLAISPLIELELRDINERVQRVETKRLASLFNVLGHLVTSELRSMTPNGIFSFDAKSLWYHGTHHHGSGDGTNDSSRQDEPNDGSHDLFWTKMT